VIERNWFRQVCNDGHDMRRRHVIKTISDLSRIAPEA